MSVSRRNAGDRIPPELPLPDFLHWARKRNEELYSSDSTPFRTPMWDFVRFCAAHPRLRGLSAKDAFRQISSAKLKDGNPFSWAEWFPDSDDPEAEFLATWGKVRVPAGDDILTLAIALAKERPLHPENCISQGYGLYMSIAGRLQELRPGDYINLPVERLGKALGVEKRTISYYAGLATTDGYISLIAKHHKPSGTAAKYKFHSERFNMETGEELKPEESSHFHKDRKDSQDCEESKDYHEKEMTSRTSEESEGRTGATGFGFDLKRDLGKLSSGERKRKMEGGQFARKTETARAPDSIAPIEEQDTRFLTEPSVRFMLITMKSKEPTDASSAASLMGRRSAEARMKKWGKQEFNRRMREWGKLGGRPKGSKSQRKAKS